MTSDKAFQRAPSLVDRLVSQFQQEIGEGRHQPGARLPTEFQIAQAYGVSRAIVREAMGRLKHDGLVLSRQGAGLFVNNPIPASSFRLPTLDFSNREEIRNIIELLITIEASASEHAAKRRTEAEMRDIDGHVAAMARAIAAGSPGVEEDVAFHRAIIRACGNPFFGDLSNFLDVQVRRFIRVARSNSALSQGLTEAVQQEHIAICEAIRRQDGPGARAAAAQHLHNAARRLAIYLDGAP